MSKKYVVQEKLDAEINTKILTLRNQQVILDRDLAQL